MPSHAFEYLRPLAAKYGIDALQVVDPRGRGFDMHKYVDRLQLEDLAEIAATYREIERRDDAMRISKWIHEVERMDEDRRRAWLLFILFGELGERGFEPFKSGTIKLLPRDEPPCDWSKLPADLHFLVEPAEKYGIYQFDNQVDEFFANATEAELEELRRLKERIGPEENRRVNRFLDEFRITQHRESRFVYFTLCLLDALE